MKSDFFTQLIEAYKGGRIPKFEFSKYEYKFYALQNKQRLQLYYPQLYTDEIEVVKAHIKTIKARNSNISEETRMKLLREAICKYKLFENYLMRKEALYSLRGLVNNLHEQKVIMEELLMINSNLIIFNKTISNYEENFDLMQFYSKNVESNNNYELLLLQRFKIPESIVEWIINKYQTLTPSDILTFLKTIEQTASVLLLQYRAMVKSYFWEENIFEWSEINDFVSKLEITKDHTGHIIQFLQDSDAKKLYLYAEVNNLIDIQHLLYQQLGKDEPKKDPDLFEILAIREAEPYLRIPMYLAFLGDLLIEK